MRKVLKTSFIANNWRTLFNENEKIYKNNLKNVKKTFLGFNANIDAITIVNKNFLNKINFKDIKSNCKSPTSIKSISDLKKALVYSFIHGKAEELKIENEKLYHWLLKNLKFNIKRMGGQTGIVANNLAKQGVKQIIVYPSILSKQQAKIFDKKVLCPTIKNKKLLLKKINNCARKDPTRINIIIEYKQGYGIKTKDKTFLIPRNNRFIISYQPFKSIPLLPNKLLISNLFKDIKRIFLAGYHHIRKENANKIFKECMEQIKKIKTLEPKCLIHIEYVDLHKRWIRKMVLKLLKLIDSFGLNEIETKNIMELIGKKEIAKKIESTKYSAKQLVKAGLILAKKFKIKRVSIHHLDFIISITDKEYGVPLDKILHSNIYGVRVVNSKGIAGDNFVKEIKTVNEYSFNKIGLTAARKKYTDKKYNIIIVPNFSRQVPIKYTVGLGDTVSSSIFFGELV